MSLFKIVSPEISGVSLSWLWRNKKWLPQSLSIESQPAGLRESPGTCWVLQTDASVNGDAVHSQFQ